MKNTIETIKNLFPVTKGHGGVIAQNVPIKMREEVLRLFREQGIPIRIRFRGSRAHSVGRLMPNLSGGTYKRSRRQANQDCLLEDAVTFTVYNRLFVNYN